MAETDRARRDASIALGLCALWILLLLAEQWRVTPQVDDAYIAYRYAANLVAGHGLVFNPGERVEGFTSPLFTGLVALGIATGVDAPLVGHALGLLGACASMLASVLLVRALAPSLPGWIAGGAPLLLWLSAPFVRWTTSGLETSLFAAGLTASLAAAAASRTGCMTAALVVTALTRPEGVLAAALLYGAGLLAPGRRRASLRGAAVFGACMLALVAARLAYYGELLPNTFYAKVGGVPLSFGVAYLRAFLVDGAAWLLLPAGFAVARLPSARPAGLLVVVFALYVVWVGGDLLGESRFLVPLLPALAALACVGAGLAWRHGRGPGALAGACVALAGLYFWVGPAPPGEGSKRARILDQARRSDRFFEAAGERRAALLRARGDRDARVATGAIGSFGYYSGLPVIDILGLTDRHIARAPREGGGARWPGHMRSDAAYVLSRKPDYLLIRRRDARGAGRLRAVSELWARPELLRDYEWDEELGGYRRRRQESPP
jgi:hypothetical protein